MARRVQQIRWYGNGAKNNQPANVTAANLRSGSVFNNYTPIVQLGIQTLPGVKFYLNNNTEPVIVGSTGIYELNVDNLTTITSLSFDIESLNMLQKMSPTTGYIIVDILYEI